MTSFASMRKVMHASCPWSPLSGPHHRRSGLLFGHVSDARTTPAHGLSFQTASANLEVTAQLHKLGSSFRNRTCCDTCGRTDFSQLQLWWQTLQFQSCLAKRTQCQHYVHTNQTSTNFGKIRPPPGYCKQILDFAHC